MQLRLGHPQGNHRNTRWAGGARARWRGWREARAVARRAVARRSEPKPYSPGQAASGRCEGAGGHQEQDERFEAHVAGLDVQVSGLAWALAGVVVWR